MRLYIVYSPYLLSPLAIEVINIDCLNTKKTLLPAQIGKPCTKPVVSNFPVEIAVHNCGLRYCFSSSKLHLATKKPGQGILQVNLWPDQEGEV